MARADSADFGFGHGEEGRGRNSSDRAGRCALPTAAGMNLAILIEDARGADQAGGVEDVVGPFGIDLEERAGLDVDAELFGFFVVAIGVLVGDGQGEALDEFFDGGIDGGGVGEFGKAMRRKSKKGS